MTLSGSLAFEHVASCVGIVGGGSGTEIDAPGRDVPSPGQELRSSCVSGKFCRNPFTCLINSVVY